MQNGAILRKAARIRFPETPSVRNSVQAGENGRANSFLNYESLLLPLSYRSEARQRTNIEHSMSEVQFSVHEED